MNDDPVDPEDNKRWCGLKRVYNWVRRKNRERKKKKFLTPYQPSWKKPYSFWNSLLLFFWMFVPFKSFFSFLSSPFTSSYPPSSMLYTPALFNSGSSSSSSFSSLSFQNRQPLPSSAPPVAPSPITSFIFNPLLTSINRGSFAGSYSNTLPDNPSSPEEERAARLQVVV
jgi:hypothetical protein